MKTKRWRVLFGTGTRNQKSSSGLLCRTSHSHQKSLLSEMEEAAHIISWQEIINDQLVGWLITLPIPCWRKTHIRRGKKDRRIEKNGGAQARRNGKIRRRWRKGRRGYGQRRRWKRLVFWLLLLLLIIIIIIVIVYSPPTERWRFWSIIIIRHLFFSSFISWWNKMRQRISTSHVLISREDEGAIMV